MSRGKGKLALAVCLLAWAGQVAVAQSGTRTDELLSLFEEFREFSEQEYGGDPASYPEAMQDKLGELREYQRRLAAIDVGEWPVSDQVDYHLVRAEMNGLEFQLRVLRPWFRDPAFYIARSGRFSERRVPEMPLSEDRRRQLQAELRAIPERHEQARKNLGGGRLSAIPGDLAILAIHQLRENGDTFDGLAARLADHHSELVSDARAARDAGSDYLRWLEQNLGAMTAPASVGVANYDWLMKNVYLFPYTWEEVRTLVHLEDNRVITFQKLEENRNRLDPPLTPVGSAQEYRRSVLDSIERVMSFIADKEIFTVQDHIVVDEYRQGRLRATGRPWPDHHDYFFNFSHRESLMEETHEMVGHHFDLLRAWNDDRPIRGAREHEGPYDMAVARLEGLAFALEELLMHAGYLDERPQQARSRPAAGRRLRPQ